MPVRDHRNSQLWRVGFHGADMQPCTIHAVRPSLLISRPARLTRFDLRFMTAFDIPREDHRHPLLPLRADPPVPPPPVSLMICAALSVCSIFFFFSLPFFEL